MTVSKYSSVYTHKEDSSDQKKPAKKARQKVYKEKKRS
jgi:hypothetical protein